MSVIIRLQNLPWSANALDIRAYFRGLAIPDGGVHIVGGEMGDAFIAFSTDEDARQGMAMDRGKINEVQVRLLLSSRAEMQKVIESARQNSLSMQMQRSSSQAAQQTTSSTPQPPVITSTTLKHILNNQPSASAKGNDAVQKFASGNQDNSSDSRDSRDDKDDIKNRERKRSRSRERHRSSRSRSRERRRSRSRDRGNNRRRYRSRSRSRDRNSRGRRPLRRNSRDRSAEKIRRRDRDSRDSDMERGYRDKDFNRKDFDSINLIDDKDVEQPPIPPPNPKNIWNQPNQIPGLQNIVSGYSTMNPTMQNLAAQMPVLSPNIIMGYQTQIQQQQQPVYGMYGQLSQLGNKVDLRNDKVVNLNTNTQPAMTSASSMASVSNLPAGVNYPFLNVFKNQDDNNKGSTTNLQNPYSAAYNTNNTHTQKNFDSKVNFSGMFGGKSPQEQNNKSGGSTYGVGNQTTNNRYGQPFHTLQNNNSNNGTESLNKDRNEPDGNFDGHCIKVINMCTGTSYSDIRRFFSGLFISNNGIKMINDNNGIRIGSAYIRFVKSISKSKALLRTGQMLKNKVVAIETITEEEFDKAIDSFRPHRRYENRNYDDSSNRNSPRNDSPNSMEITDGDNVANKTNEKSGDDDNQSSKLNEIEENIEPFTILLIKDIPPFAKEHDVMKLFSLYTITDIILVPSPENRRQNLCYVKFHRCEDASAALKNKNNHIIGHKPITVVRCSDEDFEKVKDKLNEPEPIEENLLETDQDDRLNNDNDKQEEINKTNTENDNANANANEPFGSVESKIPSLLNLIDVDKPKLDEPKKYYVLLRNCEYKLTHEDFTNFFLAFDVKPLKIEIIKNNRNLPCGECIVEVENTIDIDKCLDKSNTVLGVSRRVRIEEIPQDIAMEKLEDNENPGSYQRNNNYNSNNSYRSNNNNMNNYSRGNNYHNNNNNNRGNNNYDRKDRNNDMRKPDNYRRQQHMGGGISDANNFTNNMNNQNTSALSNTTVDQFGKPGCVVSLSNVPYKANTDDILEFFDTFDIGPQNVIRRYNDNGTPTGDARVAFKSPSEARAASLKKRNCKIFSRTVYLNVV